MLARGLNASSALAVLFSALSFLLMGVVEWIGLRWAGARVSLPAATAGFIIASGIAHSLGSTLIVSGAIRARIYARYGVSLRQVAATTLFQAVARSRPRAFSSASFEFCDTGATWSSFADVRDGS